MCALLRKNLAAFFRGDSGLGIPAEHHPRLFQSFSQVDGPIRANTAAPGWDCDCSGW